MKREHDHVDDHNGRKRPRSDGFMEAIQNGKFELRLLVSGKSAGAIIGKGGENIKSLRQKFDANVQVPDSSSPDRVCTITAEEKSVLGVVKEIIPRLEDVQSEKDPCEIRILIHQSHAGALIGKGGGKIKELREKCSARLKIYGMCCPNSTDRVLLTSGEIDNCVQILENVITELKEIPIKGQSTNYSPFNYDPQRVVEYGGFSGPMPNIPTGRGGLRGTPQGPSRGGMSNNGGGYGGGGGDFGRGDFGGYRGTPPSTNSYPIGGSHGSAGFGPVGGGGFHNNSYGYGPGGGGPVNTAQVTIPSDLGGTIIGRGGERIARIRQESGASITLEQSNGQAERIITITGTDQQIHSAQYLLQQCVRNSQAGRDRFGMI